MGGVARGSPGMIVFFVFVVDAQFRSMPTAVWGAVVKSGSPECFHVYQIWPLRSACRSRSATLSGRYPAAFVWKKTASAKLCCPMTGRESGGGSVDGGVPAFASTGLEFRAPVRGSTTKSFASLESE